MVPALVSMLFVPITSEGYNMKFFYIPKTNGTFCCSLNTNDIIVYLASFMHICLVAKGVIILYTRYDTIIVHWE